MGDIFGDIFGDFLAAAGRQEEGAALREEQMSVQQ